MATIRWLGAFAYSSDLEGSLKYELDSDPASGTVRCAERLVKGHGSALQGHIRIGLLVKNSAVVRKFNSDVYSKLGGKTSEWMGATRGEGVAYSGHTEVWVCPNYIGIVLRAGGSAISAQSLEIVRDSAKKRGVPIFKLCWDGELRKVVITNG